MVILSIADLHIESAGGQLSPGFRNNLDNFTKQLRGLDAEWAPNFVCICGDIINKGKSELYADAAKDAIREILKALNLSDNRLMMVPGNHDLLSRNACKSIAEEINETDLSKCRNKYWEELYGWLEEGKQMPELAIDSIRPYAAFRKEFLEAESIAANVQIAGDFLPGELAGVTGCRVFETEKIVFVELNSSWGDLGEDVRHVAFHKGYVENIYNQVQRYRAEGYYVVALFHHSLRFLVPEQYISDGGPNIYDRIVEISDLCLSGHEHGSKSKAPDNLCNNCQYILNGGFYSPSKKHIVDSGATLIRIDRHQELVHLRKMMRKPENNAWTIDGNIDTYSTTDTHRLSTDLTPAQPALRIAFCDSDIRRRENVIGMLFGAPYHLESMAECKGVFRYRVNKNGKYRGVAVIDAFTGGGVNLQQKPELDGIDIVVYIYNGEVRTQRDNLSRLKSLLERDILSGKCTLVPIQCTF